MSVTPTTPSDRSDESPVARPRHGLRPLAVGAVVVCVVAASFAVVRARGGTKHPAPRRFTPAAFIELSPASVLAGLPASAALPATSFKSTGDEITAVNGFNCAASTPCSFKTAADLGVNASIDGTPVDLSRFQAAIAVAWQSNWSAVLARHGGPAEKPIDVVAPDSPAVVLHALADVVFRRLAISEAPAAGFSVSDEQAAVAAQQTATSAASAAAVNIPGVPARALPAADSPEMLDAAKDGLLYSMMMEKISSDQSLGADPVARQQTWFAEALGRHDVQISAVGVTNSGDLPAFLLSSTIAESLDSNNAASVADGPPPADAAGATASIQSAFRSVVSSKLSPASSASSAAAVAATPAAASSVASSVENPTRFAGALQSLQSRYSALLATLSITVNDVSFLDDHHARVSFTVSWKGGGLPVQTGTAVLVGARWVMSADTVCSLLAVAGIGCPN